jgi:3-dehydroquinate synthase
MVRHKHSASSDNAINLQWKTSSQLETKVFIGQNAIGRLTGLLSIANAGDKVLLLRQASRFENVNESWRQSLASERFQLFDLVMPDGEACKSSESLLLVWQRLQELGFSRKDTIVALGGGALSDLAGFAAATYLRGINLVIVPTTLLAQVDAAIGGKTAINLSFGKNLAGTFYFPKAILIDPNFLSTLPERQLRSGLAEIVKCALLEETIAAETEYKPGPRSLWRLLDEELTHKRFELQPLCAGVIASAIKMKLAVVAHDPFESGLRRSLNLGHTLGHALEKSSGFALTHGEAVAIGLAFVVDLATELKLLPSDSAKLVNDLLDRVGLPTKVPDQVDFAQMEQALFHDKKRIDDTTQLILPEEKLGKVNYSYPIKNTVLLQQIRAYINK